MNNGGHFFAFFIGVGQQTGQLFRRAIVGHFLEVLTAVGQKMLKGSQVEQNGLQRRIDIMSHWWGQLTHRWYLVRLNQHILSHHFFGHVIDKNHDAGFALVLQRVDGYIVVVLTVLAVFDGDCFVVFYGTINLFRWHGNDGVGLPQIFVQDAVRFFSWNFFRPFIPLSNFSVLVDAHQHQRHGFQNALYIRLGSTQPVGGAYVHVYFVFQKFIGFFQQPVWFIQGCGAFLYP